MLLLIVRELLILLKSKLQKLDSDSCCMIYHVPISAFLSFSFTLNFGFSMF